MPRGRRPESKKWTTRSPLFPEAAAASECAGFPPLAHSDCPEGGLGHEDAMAKGHPTEPESIIKSRTSGSIDEQLSALHEAVSRKAYELFLGHNGERPGPLDDWFRAERELIWQPAIELKEKDGQLELIATFTGRLPLTPCRRGHTRRCRDYRRGGTCAQE